MSDEESRYGAYVHTTGAADGLIDRDKSAYTHDRSKYRVKQVKKSYSESDIERTRENPVSSPPPHSPQGITTGKPAEITTSAGSSVIPSVPQVSRRKLTPANKKTRSRPAHGEAQGTATESVLSTSFDSPIVTADKESEFSFFSTQYSFQRQKDTAVHQNSKGNVQSPKKKRFNAPKSRDSKYFYVSAGQRSDAGKVSSPVTSRYASAVTTGNKENITTLEQHLRHSGVSATDLSSTFVNEVKNDDDTGSRIISEGYDYGMSVAQTAEKVEKHSHSKKKPVAKKRTASAGQSAQGASQVAAQGGKKGAEAVGATSSSMAFIWVLIGVAVTVVMFMVFSLSSMASTVLETTELVLVDPNSKNCADIVNWCKWAEANKHGYVYGAFGQMCTPEYLDQQAERYPGNDEAGGESREIGNQWIGKPVYDCIGIIKAYMWYDYEDDEIYYQTNGFPDCGANSIWDSIESGKSGTIDTIPEIPGIAVWMDGHIGIYIGNGEVIEAQGVRTGVVKTQLDNGSWTHWLYIPHLDYGEFTTEPTT